MAGRTALERFEKKVIPEPASGCWLWLGCVRIAGGDFKYGLFCPTSYTRTSAHRASWGFYRGLIPQGLSVLHRCDTPLCVNPDHLFLGTQKDNMDDMTRKGRRAVGEHAGNSKLTDADAVSIQQAFTEGTTQTELAVQYGVSQAAIWYTVRRRRTLHAS